MRPGQFPTLEIMGHAAARQVQKDLAALYTRFRRSPANKGQLEFSVDKVESCRQA